MLFMGVDIGTTWSSAAFLNHQGIPTLVPGNHPTEHLRTRSVFAFDTFGPLVGQDACDAAELFASIVPIRDAKWHLDHARALATDTAGRSWTSCAMHSVLLHQLHEDALKFRGEAIDGLVIAVPSIYLDAHRRSLRRAAENIGLTVRTIVDECLAIASHYTLQTNTAETLFVLSIGSGHTEYAIVDSSSGHLRTREMMGTREVNSAAFDHSVANWIKKQVEEQNGLPGRLGDNEFLSVVERIHSTFDDPKAQSFSFRMISGTSLVRVSITRTDWEQFARSWSVGILEWLGKVVSDLAEWNNKGIRICLAGCLLKNQTVSALLEQGIRELLKSRGHGSEVSCSCNAPEHAVVYGAARLATLSEESVSTDHSLHATSVAASDLGIRVLDSQSKKSAIYKLIKRNTVLPARTSKLFRTSRPGQSRLVLEIVQSLGEIGEATRLGFFCFVLPPDLPSNHPIDVRMSYTGEGTVEIEAREPTSGTRIKQVVSYDSELTSLTADESENSDRKLIESVLACKSSLVGASAIRRV